MSFEPFGTEIGAVVADIGTTNVRIGFAGADQPRAQFSTAVGKDSAPSSSSRPTYHHDLAFFRENMSVEYPLKEGLIQDWDAYESIWNHAIKNYIRADMRETPVLLTEKAYTPSEHRMKVTELMFEKFNVPAMFLTKDAVLACYACGRTTGLVVDCGGGGTSITPVQDGWVEMKGLNRAITGGRHMDAHMLSLLQKWRPNNIPQPSYCLERQVSAGAIGGNSYVSVKPKALSNIHASYHAYMSLEMAKELKESISRVSESSLADIEGKLASIPLNQYELPDGTVIDIGVQRFVSAELLFDCTNLNMNSHELTTLGLNASRPDALVGSKENIVALAADSIYRCDLELQAALVSNLVVTGGCSVIDNLPERIRTDLENLIKASVPTCRVKCIANAPNERMLCPWLGGSILGSLGSFHEIYISRKEYLEFGSAIVDKKCP